MQQTYGAHTDQPFIATESASQWKLCNRMHKVSHHTYHFTCHIFPIPMHPVVVTSLTELLIRSCMFSSGVAGMPEG